MSEKESSKKSEKEEKSDICQETAVPIKEESKQDSEEKGLSEELKKCKERLLRTAAEYENFRKRSEREKEAIYADAISFVVLNILPLADALEAANESSENQSQEYKKGINLLKNQFDKVLENLKIESFGKVGENFNPEMHNAISHIEEESEKQNELSQIFQKGYKSPTRIIRHAMVQVTN